MSISYGEEESICHPLVANPQDERIRIIMYVCTGILLTTILKDESAKGAIDVQVCQWKSTKKLL